MRFGEIFMGPFVFNPTVKQALHEYQWYTESKLFYFNSTPALAEVSEICLRHPLRILLKIPNWMLQDFYVNEIVWANESSLCHHEK